MNYIDFTPQSLFLFTYLGCSLWLLFPMNNNTREQKKGEVICAEFEQYISQKNRH